MTSSRSRFDTDDTDEPVCPHCGHEQADAWELFRGTEDEATTECSRCEKSITITREHTVTYTTTTRWKSLTYEIAYTERTKDGLTGGEPPSTIAYYSQKLDRLYRDRDRLIAAGEAE